MKSDRRVVITGLGVLSPCGEGHRSLWQAVIERRPALSELNEEEFKPFPLRIAGRLKGFEAAKYISNRKSLKVMCRDTQIAVAASGLAREDAGIEKGDFDPDRSGVVMGAGLFNYDLGELAECFRLSATEEGRFDPRLFGETGMTQLFPLWLLKYLPNMPACHITIAHNLRGPSNTLTTDSASSAGAFEESFRIIQRNDADLMFCGGAESKINPLGLLRYHALGVLANGSPLKEARYTVFSPQDQGIVPAEGGCVLVLEEMEHALRRKARIYAEVKGVYSCANGDGRNKHTGLSESRRKAMAGALADSGLKTHEIDTVHLHAIGIRKEDEAEAQAVRELFGSAGRKPCLAFSKTITGFLGFASAATEIALGAMVLLEKRRIPSLISGRSFLADAFSFTGQDESPSDIPRSVLINHFVSSLSDHGIVLTTRDLALRTESETREGRA